MTLSLNEIKTKDNYGTKINELASSIMTELVYEELDVENDEELENFLESEESMNLAIGRIDKEWSDYTTLDIAHVYDIIQDNYRVTLNYVEENRETYKEESPVTTFRQFVLECMAYDLAKTIDSKINNILEEPSTED